MKKLILFDIDGTLILMKRSAQRAIMEYACNYALGYSVPTSAIPPLSGKTDRQIIAEILVNIGTSSDNNEQIVSNFLEGLRIATPIHSTPDTITMLDGVSQLIEFLYTHEDITLGLLTGNNRECAYFKLMPIDLDKYFTFGAFGCDHHDRRKLPPIAIQRGNQLVPNRPFSNSTTLIIGDAPGDVTCAKANDIPVLAVATGHFTEQELAQKGADAVINSFSDIDASIASIKKLLLL